MVEEGPGVGAWAGQEPAEEEHILGSVICLGRYGSWKKIT